MANTYSQIHIHIVFAVKWRKHMINPLWKNDLHNYIAAVVQNNGHKMIIVNSMPDHLHMIIGLNPEQSLSELMRRVKSHSTKWLKQQHYVGGDFCWQLGYGAFAFSKSNIKKAISYVENQSKHHESKNMRDEYISMLNHAQVEFDPRYIFTEPE